MKLAIKFLISLTLIIASSIAMEKPTSLQFITSPEKTENFAIKFSHKGKPSTFVGPAEDLVTIARSLHKKDMTVQAPALIKLTGSKGSGKSRWVRALAHILKLNIEKHESIVNERPLDVSQLNNNNSQLIFYIKNFDDIRFKYTSPKDIFLKSIKNLIRNTKSICILGCKTRCHSERIFALQNSDCDHAIILPARLNTFVLKSLITHFVETLQRKSTATKKFELAADINYEKILTLDQLNRVPTVTEYHSNVILRKAVGHLLRELNQNIDSDRVVLNRNKLYTITQQDIDKLSNYFTIYQ